MMTVLRALNHRSNGSETVEETLARLRSGSSALNDEELLPPPRTVRFGRLAFATFLIVVGVGQLLGYLEADDEIVSWQGQVTGVLCIAFGVVLLASGIRNRILLSCKGVKVRRIIRERTVPWTEIRKIDLHFHDGKWEDSPSHSLGLTTSGGEKIRLPGFEAVAGFMSGKRPPASIVAAAERLEVWRRRYDPSAPSEEHAPAGWYPDITNDGRLRYWDGALWSDHFANEDTEPRLNSENHTQPGVDA